MRWGWLHSSVFGAIVPVGEILFVFMAAIFFFFVNARLLRLLTHALRNLVDFERGSSWRGKHLGRNWSVRKP